MPPTWAEWDPKEAASPVHVLRHLLTCTSLRAVTGSTGEVAFQQSGNDHFFDEGIKFTSACPSGGGMEVEYMHEMELHWAGAGGLLRYSASLLPPLTVGSLVLKQARSFDVELG